MKINNSSDSSYGAVFPALNEIMTHQQTDRRTKPTNQQTGIYEIKEVKLPITNEKKTKI